jgi:thioredoxin reductase
MSKNLRGILLAAVSASVKTLKNLQKIKMENNTVYDAIIIGGSSAGLSAGLALGRARRKVLIIDNGQPCNAQTPHSHNFFTQDGKTPAEIAAVARKQLERYSTVEFINDLVVQGARTAAGFIIGTVSEKTISAKKLLFATGIRDIFPAIPGFSACWGISIIHCPYCHGYEYSDEVTGILANGDVAFEFAKLISNWTKYLTLYTNGASTLTEEQKLSLEKHNIHIVETEIESISHVQGKIDSLVFKGGGRSELKALYARVKFEQPSPIPVELGCELNEQGYLQVDSWMKTSIPGIYAAGDNTTPMRSIANAVYSGGLAGVMINMDLINETF